ncbi:MAG: peptidylprolyl isomerase [Bdellovibrionales bacterium]
MSQSIKWQRIWRRFKVFIILIIAVFAFAIIGLPQQRQMFTQQIRRRALSQLISRELLIQAATEENIYVSDREVMDMIVSIPAFQENGNFSRQIYESYLQSTRTDAADFEGDRRNEIVLNRLQLAFNRASKPLDVEARLLTQAKNTELDLRFATLSTQSGSINLSQKQIDDYMAKNEEAMNAYYEENKSAKYQTPEEIEARHILIKADDKVTEEQAREKIAEARKRIEAEGFEKVASEISEDPGSASRGGSLGKFGRGAMVQPFEQAAFAAAEGDIVGPVKTQFGIHLIQVEKKYPAGLKPYDSVKKEIGATLAQRDILKQIEDKVKEQLEAKNFAAVRKTLSDYKVEWQETG